MKRSLLVALGAVACLLSASPAASAAIFDTEINGIEITPGGRITAEGLVAVRATVYGEIVCQAVLTGNLNARLTSITQMTGALTRIGRIEGAVTRNCPAGVGITFRELPWDVGMVFGRSGALLEREAGGALFQFGFLGVILGMGITLTRAERRCEFRRKAIDFLYTYALAEFGTGGILGSLRNLIEECMGVRAEFLSEFELEPIQTIRVLLLNP